MASQPPPEAGIYLPFTLVSKSNYFPKHGFTQQQCESPLRISKPKSLPSLILFKNQNSEENIKRYHGGYSHSPLDDTVVDTGSHKRSEIWKTVWDTKTVSGCHHGSNSFFSPSVKIMVKFGAGQKLVLLDLLFLIKM